MLLSLKLSERLLRDPEVVCDERGIDFRTRPVGVLEIIGQSTGRVSSASTEETWGRAQMASGARTPPEPAIERTAEASERGSVSQFSVVWCKRNALPTSVVRRIHGLFNSATEAPIIRSSRALAAETRQRYKPRSFILREIRWPTAIRGFSIRMYEAKASGINAKANATSALP